MKRYGKFEDGVLVEIILNEERKDFEELPDDPTVVCGYKKEGGKLVAPPIPPLPYDVARARAGIGSKDGEQLDAMSKHRQKQKLLVGKARAAAAKGDLAGALAHALEALEPTDELNALDAWRMELKEDNPKPE